MMGKFTNEINMNKKLLKGYWPHWWKEDIANAMILYAIPHPKKYKIIDKFTEAVKVKITIEERNQ